MSHGFSLARQFQGDLEQVIDEYRNRGLTRGEVVGRLEIVKSTLILITPEEEPEAQADPGYRTRPDAGN